MKNKILTVNELINMSEADKINAYMNGYALSMPYTSSNIQKLGTSDCIDNIQQGTIKNITISIVSSGTPGYIYKLYIKEASATDFTLIDTYPRIIGATNDTSHIFSHIFDEAVGSYIIKTEVVDSCTLVSLSDESMCSINIVPAAADICIWIDSKGGVTTLTVTNIFELVDAYLGIASIDFTPTITEIFGCVDYYLGNIPSGNAGTGCSY